MKLTTQASSFPGGLASSTMDRLSWLGFVEGCPVHGRMFSSVSGLHPPDARNTPCSPPTVDNTSVLRHCHMFPGGDFFFLVENNQCYRAPGWEGTSGSKSHLPPGPWEAGEGPLKQWFSSFRVLSHFNTVLHS